MPRTARRQGQGSREGKEQGQGQGLGQGLGQGQGEQQARLQRYRGTLAFSSGGGGAVDFADAWVERRVSTTPTPHLQQPPIAATTDDAASDASLSDMDEGVGHSYFYSGRVLLRATTVAAVMRGGEVNEPTQTSTQIQTPTQTPTRTQTQTTPSALSQPPMPLFFSVLHASDGTTKLCLRHEKSDDNDDDVVVARLPLIMSRNANPEPEPSPSTSTMSAPAAADAPFMTLSARLYLGSAFNDESGEAAEAADRLYKWGEATKWAERSGSRGWTAVSALAAITTHIAALACGSLIRGPRMSHEEISAVAVLASPLFSGGVVAGATAGAMSTWAHLCVADFLVLEVSSLGGTPTPTPTLAGTRLLAALDGTNPGSALARRAERASAVPSVDLTVFLAAQAHGAGLDALVDACSAGFGVAAPPAAPGGSGSGGSSVSVLNVGLAPLRSPLQPSLPPTLAAAWAETRMIRSWLRESRDVLTAAASKASFSGGHSTSDVDSTAAATPTDNTSPQPTAPGDVKRAAPPHSPPPSLILTHSILQSRPVLVCYCAYTAQLQSRH